MEQSHAHRVVTRLQQAGGDEHEALLGDPSELVVSEVMRLAVRGGFDLHSLFSASDAAWSMTFPGSSPSAAAIEMN